MIEKSTPTDSAVELLHRIGIGSDTALADFYRLYESRIYAFALNRLNDPHAAADIVNEVMLAVWRGADRFKGDAKVTTWLFGIAHHKVVDHLRKAKRLDHGELEADMIDDDLPATMDLIAIAEDSQQVCRCLEKLSDAHKQVVHLAFFEDLSYSEIAGIVQCPEGTVKTRMFHAKQLLKRCLERLYKEGEL